MIVRSQCRKFQKIFMCAVLVATFVIGCYSVILPSPEGLHTYKKLFVRLSHFKKIRVFDLKKIYWEGLSV